MKAKALQDTLPFIYNPAIKYLVGPYTDFIRTCDGLIKQDIQVNTNEGDCSRPILRMFLKNI